MGSYHGGVKRGMLPPTAEPSPALPSPAAAAEPAGEPDQQDRPEPEAAAGEDPATAGNGTQRDATAEYELVGAHAKTGDT